MVQVEAFKDGLGVERFRVIKICESLAEAANAAMLLSNQLPPQAFQPTPPPNCDGMNAGEYRAQVQYDAAESGPDSRSCASGVCGMGD